MSVQKNWRDVTPEGMQYSVQVSTDAEFFMDNVLVKVKEEGESLRRFILRFDGDEELNPINVRHAVKMLLIERDWMNFGTQSPMAIPIFDWSIHTTAEPPIRSN